MKTVCDTVYVLEKVKKGMSYVYNRTDEFTTSNCIDVAEDCEVTFKSTTDKTALTETVTYSTTCEPVKEGGEKPTPEPDPEPTPEVKTKTVCDTVYELIKTKKGMTYVYSRGESFTTTNCITVAEDCEVTYAAPVQDKTALTETVTAVYSCEAIKED